MSVRLTSLARIMYNMNSTFSTKCARCGAEIKVKRGATAILCSACRRRARQKAQRPVANKAVKPGENK